MTWSILGDGFNLETSNGVGPSNNWTRVLGVPVFSGIENVSIDYFIFSSIILGTNYSFTGSNRYATKDPGESNHAGNPGGHSLWWTWTASTSFRVALDTIGSRIDTALAVYTGNSVSNLNLVCSNANSVASTVYFTPIAGTTYQIAIDGWSGGVGDVALNFLQLPPPSNDDFSKAAVLTGSIATESVVNWSATREVGEPNHVGRSSGQSVWWTWTPSVDMDVVFSTAGSSCETTLAVYTGSAISALSTVASNSNQNSSQVGFHARSGVNYSVAVDGSNGEVGMLVLNLEGPAPNDSFSTSTTLMGTNITTRTLNIGATKEAGEPNHAGNSGGHSLWWNWTATDPGLASVDTIGSRFNTALGVYTGSSVTNLSLVASNANWRGSAVLFKAVAGTTYDIAVDGWSGEIGELQLNFSTQPLPANDDFANRITLAGTHLSSTASNVGASREQGEPNHAGDAATLSLWWTWTAPAKALAQIDTTGSAISTAVAIYTGNSLTNLSLVASNASGHGSAVAFYVTEGTTYQIAVAGSAGSQGSLVLNLQTQPPPANDNFSDSIQVTGTNITVSGSNLGATHEPGEPIHALNPRDPSVWWSWTAPANMLVEINTSGSASNTALGVYTGTAVTNLTLIASNSFYSFSTVRFNAFRGTPYRVAVDGWNGAMGAVKLNFVGSPGPANDDFENRALLTGFHLTITATNSLASRESGELLPGGATGQSLWWSWIAPSNGMVTLNISNGFGSTYSVPPGWSNGPLVGVYAGAVQGNLFLVASNTAQACWGSAPCGWYGLPSVSFPVTAGQTYQFSMDGLNGSSGVGSIELSLDSPAQPPPNDAFTSAIRLTGYTVNTTGTTASATYEPGEHQHGALTNAGSVWWSWSSADSGTVSISVYPGLEVDVYAGSSLSRLIPVAAGTGAVSFYALAGTVYSIAVSDSGAASGRFWLSLTGPQPPPAAESVGSSARPNGRFRLHVRGQVGQGFVIQASTNLTQWESIGFNSLSGGAFDFIDIDTQGFPARFYRVLPLDAVLDTLALQVLGTDASTNGAVVVRIGGPAGQPFYLQASTDLQNWSDLTRGVIVDDEFDFLDASGGQLPSRVYRVIPP